MSKKWSKYFQLPELLEYTRQYMLTGEMRELIMKHMLIKDGDRILEVGCGTGYLSRYLSRGRRNLSITGIDFDEHFICRAQELAQKEESTSISFLQANAKEIPFADNSFDRIVSHTFLTSTKEPERSLAEMHRVVKPGGTISSITPMSVKMPVLEPGIYPADCRFIADYRALSEKVCKMYESVNSIANYINALDSSRIPRMFVDEGLQNISLFPIGYAFSFSDGALPLRQRREYIDLSYLEEKQKFENYISLGAAEGVLTDEEIGKYPELLLKKKEYLLEHIDDNAIFEWVGNVNIMVTGKA